MMVRPEVVEGHVVELPLRRPFVTSFGEERTKRALLLRLVADGGEGWGECVAGAGPWFSAETVESAQHVIREFALPLLRQGVWPPPREVAERLAPIRGHPMAKAALEAATWDLYCRARGVSLREELGGTRREVEAGVSLGIERSLEELLVQVSAAVEQGYRRVKLKIKPEWDVDAVAAVRERYPDLPLTVDANASYTLDDALHLKEIDAYGLVMIEQPLAIDDLVGHGRLAGLLETPLCLDESVSSPQRAWEALELGACRVINIKQGRVGGLRAALGIHRMAHERGVPVWCGGMLETGLGRALNVALATLPGFSLPGDISATARYWDDDVAKPHFVLTQRGTVAVPEGPGLGVEIDASRLAESRVARWTERI
ncbi:MAG: o-succinylbenzoate synthase [Candidatus Bipolaricaulota bacterium]